MKLVIYSAMFLFWSLTLTCRVVSETIGNVEVLSGWGTPVDITLQSVNGLIQAQRQQLTYIDKSYPGASSDPDTFELIYIPSLNLYWLGPPYGSYFVLDNAIVGIATDRGDYLRFDRLSYQLSAPLSASSSQQVIRNELSARFSNINGRFNSDQVVPLMNVLGMFPFRSGRPTSMLTPAPLITSVIITSVAVSVSLLGDDGITSANITFNHQLQPVSATLDGKLKFPAVQDGSPTITSFSPTSGPMGTRVTITGANFASEQFTVTLNSHAAVACVINSPTQITALVPDCGLAPGDAPITSPWDVATENGVTRSEALFTILGGGVDPALLPTLTAFTPASGSSRTAVTLTGTNFTGATVVRFGSRDADDFTVDGPTQITAHPPGVSKPSHNNTATAGDGGGGSASQSSGGLGPFTGKISVVTPAGTATSAADFSVVVPPFDPPGGGEPE